MCVRLSFPAATQAQIRATDYTGIRNVMCIVYSVYCEQAQYHTLLTKRVQYHKGFVISTALIQDHKRSASDKINIQCHSVVKVLIPTITYLSLIHI